MNLFLCILIRLKQFKALEAKRLVCLPFTIHRVFFDSANIVTELCFFLCNL